MALIWQVIYYQRQKIAEEEVFPGETSVLIGSSSLPTYDTTQQSSATIASTTKNKKTKIFNWASAIAIILVTAISCYTYYNAHWKHHSDDDSNRLAWLPQTMGWTSAVLYVGSRIPQILKNYKHKSTEGLSFGMFICAVLGNVLFTSVSFNFIYNEFYSLI